MTMGPVSTAIERRALRNALPDAIPHPVTARGRSNAAITEMRGLSSYIERGRAYIQEASRKLVGATLQMAADIKSGPQLARLQQAAGRFLRGASHARLDMEKERDQTPSRDRGR